MVSEAPPFWWEKPGIESALLAPFGWLYGKVAARIMRTRKRRTCHVPVICVGNLTVGGSGKTPVAIALAEAAKARGLTPGFLSRGYGGAIHHATRVDLAHHTARLVGDEPMLLARAAMTVVSPDRPAGAKLLEKEGADLIIMDDGFQSATLVFDEALIVIDAGRGVGNGRILPAGPLRAPIADQVRAATALVVVGSGNAADGVIRLAARAAKPVHMARLVPLNAGELAGKNCLAFAAIGDPGKFFRTLEEAGVRVAREEAFPDHHMFTADEIASLLADADLYGLTPVTTEKDAIRLAAAHGKSDDLLQRSNVLRISAVFESRDEAGHIIDRAMAAFRRRRTGI